jgi:hypothetical protein
MKRIMLVVLIISIALLTTTSMSRVQICHKGRTIRVARSAVPAHLRHGDYTGPCHNQTPTPNPDPNN